MKCVTLPELKDGPCKRCQAGNHDCIFEESNRGKRSSKYVSISYIQPFTVHSCLQQRPCRSLPIADQRIMLRDPFFNRKHEQLTKSLRKMERTLDTVLRSISNPALSSLAAGMVSQSSSPGPDGESSVQDAVEATDGPEIQPNLSEGLVSQLPDAATYGAAVAPAAGSPRLHSLPDNVLNPLGLLAEASSSIRRTKPAAGHSPGSTSGSKNPMSISTLDNPKVGVANLGVYFKPGPMTILPLRQLIIERQVQVWPHGSASPISLTLY